MTGQDRYDEVGSGTISRVAVAVYWFAMIEVLLVVTAAPGLVMLTLLDRHPSNIPLVGVACLPLGPSLAAAVFAWRTFLREKDLSPARHFWRGYRLNVLDVLRIWVPAVVVLTILWMNLTYSGALGLPMVLVLVTALVALGVLLWSMHALVITALFAFRARDVARIAGHYLLGKVRVTLGAASLVVLAGGVVAFTSDWVLALLASLFSLLVLRNGLPMVEEVQERFVA